MKNLILFISLLVPVICLAQQDSTSRTISKVYFGNSPENAVNYNANSLKLGIFDIVSGKYGVYFEKEISDYFSIEAGTGLTGMNFAASVYSEAIEGEDKDGIQTSPNFSAELDIYDENFDF